MTGENAAPAEMPVASHGIASGETQPDLCSTAATQAPAAMPSVEEIRDLLCGYVPTLDASTEAARAILDLFAPILAEKELHHETGERITRKDLNNAHRKGAEEGRIAAHLIDGISAERQRDEALEALRALVDCHAVFTGEPGHDAEVWARADEKARLVLENGPAGLADAHTKSPLSDLSSLRKGAEVMREAIEDAIEKLNTYRGAAVQTVIDQLEAALVSGSREERRS